MTTADLPAFNSVAECPKCRAWVKDKYADIQYCTDGYPVKTVTGQLAWSPTEEWIKRTCPRCGYHWREACADKVVDIRK
jgi:hypothetical protein